MQRPSVFMDWQTPVIPALMRLRQDECEFKASWGYTVKACPKNKEKKRKKEREKKNQNILNISNLNT
jgi:hypothetical protein